MAVFIEAKQTSLFPAANDCVSRAARVLTFALALDLLFLTSSAVSDRCSNICSGKEAVGRKIAMQKPKGGDWLPGKLVEFNPATGQHKV